jgi:hypothetical protein
LGAIRKRLLRVKRAFLAGEALDDQAGILVNEYAHEVF